MFYLFNHDKRPSYQGEFPTYQDAKETALAQYSGPCKDESFILSGNPFEIIDEDEYNFLATNVNNNP